MSRLHVLVHRPRRTLAALATVLVAVGITAASGADFNATSANPNNSFATGTLAISNSKPATFILQASNLKPGGPAASGTVDVGNTGTLSGAFTLTRGTITDSDATNKLSTKLNVTLVDCGTDFSGAGPTCEGSDPVKYTGTLAGMSSAVDLGNWAGGEQHRFQLNVAVDSSADNAYQGDSSQVSFTWNAA